MPFVDDFKKILSGEVFKPGEDAFNQNKLNQFRMQYLTPWSTDKTELARYAPFFSYKKKDYVLLDIISLTKENAKVFVSYGNGEQRIESEQIILDITDQSNIKEASKRIKIANSYLNGINVNNYVFVYSIPKEITPDDYYIYGNSSGAIIIYGKLVKVDLPLIEIKPILTSEIIKGEDNLFVSLDSLVNVESLIMASILAVEDPILQAIPNITGKKDIYSLPPVDRGSFIVAEKDTTINFLVEEGGGGGEGGEEKVSEKKSKPSLSSKPYEMRNMIAAQIKRLEMQQTKLSGELDKINKEIKTLEYEVQQLACKRETIDPKNKGGIDNASEKIKEKRKEITEKEYTRNKINRSIMNNNEEIRKARGEMIALLPALLK